MALSPWCWVPMLPQKCSMGFESQWCLPGASLVSCKVNLGLESFDVDLVLHIFNHDVLDGLERFLHQGTIIREPCRLWRCSRKLSIVLQA